ncbi:MAG: cytochrome b/b6 domain-containing protein [Chloroflexi bacterium]|nr:cytochrome b/b6 domain-containing protein [Chloroflexota bacterium]
MSRPARYHPILVIIHWLSAVLVVSMLLMGIFFLKQMPNTEAKIPYLAIHMVIGITILLLTILRLVLRFSTRLPAPARSGSAFLDMLGNVTHMLLYMVMLAMALIGMGTASQAGLMDIVFGGSGAPLPGNLYIFPARIWHGYIGLALVALIGLHLAGAFYHQYLRRDNLIARMSLRKPEA